MNAMEKERKKKGFWASLFAPRACSCSCGENLVVETDNKAGEPEEGDTSNDHADNENTCGSSCSCRRQ